jgi:hypothetical protein
MGNGWGFVGLVVWWWVVVVKGKMERGFLEWVWYGQVGDDWKQKRDQREKEALEEGKGYGDLIMEQIWEVWNWGGKKTDQAADSEDQSRKEQGSK